MQSPDGQWRVEIVHRTQFAAKGAFQSDWYRIVHGEDVIDWLSINEVARILAEAGIDMGTLVEAA